ncbi:MAG: PhoX family phosphatase [Actinobacteria bacterium]|nr:PhoX family phosphatase [Actinomycetota bacterium]
MTINFDSEDIGSNTSDNRTFEDVLTSFVSRRSVLAGGAAAAAFVFAGASNVKASAVEPTRRTASGVAAKARPKIDFTSIPLQNSPMPTIAPEYQYKVILPWRTRLDGKGEFPEGLTSDQQAISAGIGHDGMHYFGDDSVGIFYIEEGPKGWSTKKDKRNRRIHVNTPVEFSGPAAKSALLVNTAGNEPQGTVNNCANGYTPWGTYITCEENFNGYFGSTSTAWKASAEEARYGVTATGNGYDWHKFDPRFDRSQPGYQNEVNRFGWVVEIDPENPKAKPVKRTALGRVKHEGAEVVVGKGNRVVVYMGDDERFDYIYKFVSARDYKKMLAAGKSPLDEGTLYAARFNDDGTGNWLELSPRNPALSSWTIDKILVHTRLAADLAGATKMDRPEWISTGADGWQYGTLTNNTNRGRTGQPGVNAANPLVNNSDGHIIRWKDSDGNLGGTFQWNLFLVAKETFDGGGQMFGSPDGIWADPDGRIFILTDGTQPGANNDQMLVADAKTKEIKRIFTGVKGCEVTGVAVTPNRKTMFVNLQHPGDGDPKNSNFPAPFTGAAGPKPRDCTIVITRKDGGIIGS